MKAHLRREGSFTPLRRTTRRRIETRDEIIYLIFLKQTKMQNGFMKVDLCLVEVKVYFRHALLKSQRAARGATRSIIYHNRFMKDQQQT